ncbi:hypothetical protein ACQPZQ_39435 [Pseudonocardia sp. CA-142604]|uniref:hypothetical protein n=1 Tax=Pseudonocardia sp. CA-142604 TaxID=3240024 RepID=UPI003D8F0CF7
MTDAEETLRAGLRDPALDEGISATALLAGVQARQQRLHRRRQHAKTAMAALAAVLVVGGAAVATAHRPVVTPAHQPPAVPAPGPVTAPPTVTPIQTPSTAPSLPTPPLTSAPPVPGSPPTGLRSRTVQPAPSAEPGISDPTGRPRRPPAVATTNPEPPTREIPPPPVR